ALQAGGRRFDPGWLHFRSTCKPDIAAGEVAVTIHTPVFPVRADQEALREERRLRRRRWARRVLILMLLGGAAVIGVLIASSGGATKTATGAGSAGALRTGQVVALGLAGPLAVASDGALYVADVARDRVLVRLHDGRFRVAVGDGRVGFAGDGGPAVHAQLSAVSDLVLAPDGSLYIADGGRVRVVDRDGVIRTIAGDGRGAAQQLVASGTPALRAPLGSTDSILRHTVNALSIALSPSGQLYISTGSQILRVTAAGKLDVVRAVVPSGLSKGPLRGFGPIAVDAHGNIDVGGGPRGWSIWQVAPDGIAHYVGFARRSGGDYAVLEPGPDAAIYADSGAGIVRVDAHRLVPTFMFNERLRGQYFPLTYFAFSPHGTTYADDIPGGDGFGFEAHQQLLSVSNDDTRLLWQEHNAAPK
ncbi:MAG TPA: hypothetical protein VGH56_06995, partial [Solirubrobacteraceae bacterium]